MATFQSKDLLKLSFMKKGISKLPFYWIFSFYFFDDQRMSFFKIPFFNEHFLSLAERNRKIFSLFYFLTLEQLFSHFFAWFPFDVFFCVLAWSVQV